ncbi:bifunctional phosphopantothenoylcysteine decarboxylase/phosphopantothenate--cysteine ligase CoaBC [Nitrososphaera sp.]|uniref:bifunctional phosphopantothenoylcysteine decarboxylase/phosphopantothenate--cysteine ligase CoaBC n=1 Tax=Nitrososphaera sp. TaxID=1971748 RepID=UPI00307E2935
MSAGHPEQKRHHHHHYHYHHHHPSKDITGSKGQELAGRKIVLCITGSVAAYRAIDLARLLMRHGADVHAVMSEATAATLLHPDMVKWATGNEVVTKLTGELEHIRLADYGMSDLVVVYPCTANTIGKAANGIDDTPVTSVLSVALGSKIPIIIAPAMHEAMYENPFIQDNVKKLQGRVTFVGPNMEEGKAKAAEPEEVLDAAIRLLAASGSLAGKKVLVTAGSTVEHIDPIRVITNMSSGKMGIAIANEAARMGATVTLVYGHGTENPQGNIVRVHTSQEMHDAVARELGSSNYDVVVMAAAVADYTPTSKSPKKIETRSGGVEISLKPTTKIIDMVKKKSKGTFLVAFKADHGVPQSELVEKAYRKLQESGADLVVANDLANVAAGSDVNEVFMIDRDKKVERVPLASKQAVARRIMEAVADALRR